jgi:hypothetical protein
MAVTHSSKIPVSPEMLACPDLFLSKGNLLWLLGLTDESLRQRIARGVFPPPDLLDGRRPRWLVRTFLEWRNGALSASIDAERQAVREALDDPHTPVHRAAELQRQQRRLLDRQRALARADRRDARKAGEVVYVAEDRQGGV